MKEQEKIKEVCDLLLVSKADLAENITQRQYLIAQRTGQSKNE